MSSILEVFSITPVESQTGLKNFRVYEHRQWLAHARCLESATVVAVGNAEVNGMGDGNYVVSDCEGRDVAVIAVRDGSPVVTTNHGGPTSGEQLDSLKSVCPTCGRRFILVACSVCGKAQCSSCCLHRKCCPPSYSPQEE